MYEQNIINYLHRQKSFYLNTSFQLDLSRALRKKEKKRKVILTGYNFLFAKIY